MKTIYNNLPRIASYILLLVVKSTFYDTSGYVIVWNHATAPPGHEDIYAQLVDRYGIRMWLPKLALCVNVHDKLFPKIAMLEGPSFAPRVVTAWEDHAGADIDLYANMLTVQTATVNNSSTGYVLCTQAYDQRNLVIDTLCSITENSYHAIIGWEDWREDTTANIFYQDISIDAWTFNKQSDGWPVTMARKDQIFPELGRNVFAYNDYRRTPVDDLLQDKNIYCQKIGEDCDAPTIMRWKDVFARWSLTSPALNCKYALDAEGKTEYAAWDERRTINIAGDTIHGVYVQKLDRYGVPRWSNDGILVSNPNNYAFNPAICWTGDGGAYVAWQEREAGQTDCQIMLAVLDKDGAMTGPRSVHLNTGGEVPGHSYSPALAWSCDDDRVDFDHTAWVMFLNVNGGVYSRYFVKITKTVDQPDYGVQAWNHFTPFTTVPLSDPIIVSDRAHGAYTTKSNI
jgi:hypothetical protein